jgi:hydrogenase nickel incorporation protein HypA/HybF
LHELALAQALIGIVTARSGGARVTRVVVEIGELAAVAPAAMHFCFDVAANRTVAQGATLEIVATPGLEVRVREMEVVDV